MTMERRRLRWSLSPPLCVLDAYSLLIDIAKIRLASALTSIAVVALMFMRNYARLFGNFTEGSTSRRGLFCPELDFSLRSAEKLLYSENVSVEGAGWRFISSLT